MRKMQAGSFAELVTMALSLGRDAPARVVSTRAFVSRHQVGLST